MDNYEQIELLKTMIKSLETEMLSKCDKWSPDWNGFELRQLLDDKVKETINYRKMDRKRLKDYKNHKLVNNI